MNMFLAGLPDEDFRGWKFDKDCDCIRCKQFYYAALSITDDEETPSK